MASASLKKAHKHCIRNIDEVEESEMCGCFSCIKTFEASEISGYADDDKTVLCPYCDTDAVIGDASGIDLNDDFLQKMHDEYFGDPEDDEYDEEEDDDDMGDIDPDDKEDY